ncbi:hypothetical protein [Candidatus Similichlamydia laticola]|uniref:Uncharacterized protein n=1 Tax=Candidatus Similichlamydia laticola TaxID=2170265 RepID=A0A369KE61_9BACT|nr:hypothetical protein [Candidatus Similichlamydia laticola]RDB31187.1 hypothetical protein HAT2_00667 [Candidatus Similichlamydia laticola]
MKIRPLGPIGRFLSVSKAQIRRVCSFFTKSSSRAALVFCRFLDTLSKRAPPSLSWQERCKIAMFRRSHLPKITKSVTQLFNWAKEEVDALSHSMGMLQTQDTTITSSTEVVRLLVEQFPELNQDEQLAAALKWPFYHWQEYCLEQFGQGLKVQSVLSQDDVVKECKQSLQSLLQTHSVLQTETNDFIQELKEELKDKPLEEATDYVTGNLFEKIVTKNFKEDIEVEQLKALLRTITQDELVRNFFEKGVA